MKETKMATNQQLNKRIGWIDIAKAMGIILVLINHSNFSSNAITFFGGMVYMPIFLVVAGYTFNLKEDESIGEFVKKKAKRLLVPYVIFNLVLIGIFAIKDIVISHTSDNIMGYIVGALYSRNVMYPVTDTFFGNATNNNIYLMTVLNAPTWFLTAMFVSICLFRIIMPKIIDNRKKMLISIIVLLGLSFILEKFCPILLPWSLDTTFLFVAFMIVGYYLKEIDFIDRTKKQPVIVVAVILLVIGLSVVNQSVNLSVRDYGLSVFVYFIVAVLGCICLIWLSNVLELIGFIDKILEYIGKHTIVILCLHLVVFAVVQAVGTIVGINALVVKIMQIIVSLIVLSILDKVLIS